MHVDSDEDVGGFQGAAASVAVWVWCLMDGHSSPTHPDSPMVPPSPVGDEQAHYYSALIKRGHYISRVHFEL